MLQKLKRELSVQNKFLKEKKQSKLSDYNLVESDIVAEIISDKLLKTIEKNVC